MKFAFLIYDDENAWAKRPESEQRRIIGEFHAYSSALREEGAHLTGNPLAHSRDAKRVRKSGGRAQIQDGPFTDAKEQLGGYYVVEAKDLDRALDMAARCPGAALGRIEVRPIKEFPA